VVAKRRLVEEFRGVRDGFEVGEVVVERCEAEDGCERCRAPVEGGCGGCGGYWWEEEGCEEEEFGGELHRAVYRLERGCGRVRCAVGGMRVIEGACCVLASESVAA
jgi:hypothetical protein